MKALMSLAVITASLIANTSFAQEYYIDGSPVATCGVYRVSRVVKSWNEPESKIAGIRLRKTVLREELVISNYDEQLRGQFSPEVAEPLDIEGFKYRQVWNVLLKKKDSPLEFGAKFGETDSGTLKLEVTNARGVSETIDCSISK